MRKGPVAGTDSIVGWGLKIFTNDMLSKIHAATLDVMESTGLFMGSDEAVDILEKTGCWVEKKRKIVRFPKHIVNEAISLSPSHVLLAARDSTNDFMVGGKEIGFTTFGVGITMEDMETGEVRETTKKDVEQIAMVSDALPNIDVITAPVTPREKPDTSQEFHMAEACFTYSSKHYHSDAENGDHARKLIGMAAAITGGIEELRRKPIISFCICPTSPLQLIRGACEVAIEAARNRIPLDVLSMAMAGASSPISISGTLVTHNAEVLAGITLAQMTNAGTPCIYGSSTTTLDMKHATAVVGAPELGMISAAVSEMANFYGLPSYVGGL